MTAPVGGLAGKDHWDDIYRRVGPEQMSWYQPTATVSLDLVDTLAISRAASVVDVGGGASCFASDLARCGFLDLTVVDISSVALTAAAAADPRPVCRLQQDILAWEPDRTYDVWHDRAVFHFLTDDGDRSRYRQVLRRATHPGSLVVVATFAPDGPATCSGLEVCRYSPDDLAAALGDLDLLDARHVTHTTPAGGCQAFTWIAATIAC